MSPSEAQDTLQLQQVSNRSAVKRAFLVSTTRLMALPSRSRYSIQVLTPDTNPFHPLERFASAKTLLARIEPMTRLVMELTSLRLLLAMALRPTVPTKESRLVRASSTCVYSILKVWREGQALWPHSIGSLLIRMRTTFV